MNALALTLHSTNTVTIIARSALCSNCSIYIPSTWISIVLFKLNHLTDYNQPNHILLFLQRNDFYLCYTIDNTSMSVRLFFSSCLFFVCSVALVRSIEISASVFFPLTCGSIAVDRVVRHLSSSCRYFVVAIGNSTAQRYYHDDHLVSTNPSRFVRAGVETTWINKRSTTIRSLLFGSTALLLSKTQSHQSYETR